MVIRPFTLPCGTVMVFIVNPTGGVLGGDHAEIRVSVGPGARVLLLTQSATRIQPSRAHPSGPEHSGPGQDAVQDVVFTVAAGGRLEYYPERTLPFAGSRFAQTVRAELETGAEFGLTETLAVGRVAMGERLKFARYRSQVEVWQGGRRVYLDRIDVRPESQNLDAPGLLGGRAYSASGVWVAGQTGAGTQALIQKTGAGAATDLPAVPGMLACGLNHAGAVWMRAAAERGPDLDLAVSQTRETLRHDLFGAAPLQIRR
ncbi:urease accessory protein UreD [Deinococcus sp. UYEF24]